ncbi:MAG TPA: peptidase, partial [Vicinamibacteria bacterium]|nr:peptidase [Vicinamibacteria bacterium]
MKDLGRASLQAYAKRARPAYERWLKRLVEIPSVSSDPAHAGDCARVAHDAAELVESLGGRA